jgi:D-glycero-D-manno-heptose 1,7-bisphosphate phosphatase
MSADRAVFLDRDGVLNQLVLNPATGDHESPYRAEDVALAPGAAEALRLLRSLGVPLVVVSNQPSAAKGTADLAALAAVHDAVVARLADEGLAVDEVRYCFHHPAGTDRELGRACDCRKPAPGLILQAADALGLDAAALERSWLIGDSDVDVEAGRAAGLRTVLVEDPRSAHRRFGAEATARAADVLEAARIVAADAAAAPTPLGEEAR